MVHAWRAAIELWMHAGSWESTKEAFEWHEAKPSPSQLLESSPNFPSASITR